MGNYNLDVPLKWTIFEARDAGTAGWLSAQIEYQTEPPRFFRRAPGLSQAAIGN